MSLRVILVVDEFPARSETFIANKVVGLVDAGYDVHVLCAEPGSAPAWSESPALAGRDDVRARVHRGRPALEPRALLGAAATLARTAARPGRFALYAARRARDDSSLQPLRALSDAPLFRLEPDVVHFEFGTEALRREPVLAMLDCPVTVSLRGFDVNYKYLDRADAYVGVWPHVTAVHTLGDELWRRARRRGWPVAMPVAIIPPAVDVDFFTAPADRDCGTAGTAGRPLRLVTVARLHWKKDLPTAISAVRQLVDGGLVVDYRIVGTGPARQEIEAAIADHGLAGTVELVGHASPAAVRDELARADVLVHSAVSEGFANSVLEAQSMALPVVCTDADGLAENIAPDETGLLVPRRDSVALADAIAVLAGDGLLRDEMGRAGRKRVEAIFRVDRQVGAWCDFYEGVAAGRLPPPRPLNDSPSGELVRGSAR